MNWYSFENPSVFKRPSPVAVLAVAFPLIGILLAEGLLTAGFVTAGLLTHLFILFFCSLIPLYLQEMTSLFSGFILLPVFRLSNLAMPVFVELTLYWIPFVYIPFAFAGGLLFLRVNDLQLPDSRHALVWLPLTFVGATFVAELVHRFDPAPFLIPTPTAAGLTLLIGIVIMIAIVEEVLFRGLLQSTLDNYFGPGGAVVLASIVFGAMQSPATLPAGAVAVLSGLAYGSSYVYSNSLVIPILFHVVVNLLLFVVFQISGPFSETIL